MKIETFKKAKSSFLSADKDFSIIIDKFLSDERLKRLLYYTTSDALNRPNLTQEQSLNLLGKNIKIIPKLQIDKEVLNYVIISFDNFAQSGNPEFRDNTISFDIICHFNQWELDDAALRPYKIAGEIDSLMNDTELTGIGKLNFLGASQIVINAEFAGLTLLYETVHGGEDKFNLSNPAEEERFEEEYNERENQESEFIDL